MASVLNEPWFSNEAEAFAELERLVWPNGPVCPFCGNMGRMYALTGVRSKPSKKHPEGIERHGLRKCGECRKQFTVRKGTVFEDSPVPLHLWFQAAYLLCASKKGISSNQLSRTLGVTLQTAWFMGHRLREAMRSGVLAPMGGEGAAVEIDETYIGRKPGVEARPGWVKHKHAVLTLVERGGVARCSEKHLHRYLAEFDFRYNNRVRLGVNDSGRTENALRGIVGRRLTYRDSSAARV
jgi:transposase-like protein